MPQPHSIRVLHVVRTLSVGGLEVGVVNLVNGLEDLGFKQAILCLEHQGELADQVSSSVPVWTCATKQRAFWNRHEFLAIRFIRQFQPDIVHARNYGAWIDAVFAWLFAGRPGRMAFTVHGWDSNAPMSKKRAWLCRMLARFTHALAAVSLHTARDFAQESGIAESRFTELFSGVDTQRFTPRGETLPVFTDERLVIGCVARLAPVKGLDVLLEAFAHVKQLSSRPIELRLIGDGPLREKLQSQAERLSLGSSVRFLGNCSDIPEQLRDLDIFVLPSLREGRPTSIMEAMATGLPVIATTVGSVPELVDDGQTGLLVPPGNVESLATALKRLVDDVGFRHLAGQAARQKALRRLSLASMVENYARFYEALAPIESLNQPLTRNSG